MHISIALPTAPEDDASLLESQADSWSISRQVATVFDVRDPYSYSQSTFESLQFLPDPISRSAVGTCN